MIIKIPVSADGSLCDARADKPACCITIDDNGHCTIPGQVECVKFDVLTKYSNEIKSIAIQNGVKTIQDFAFANLRKLQWISIPFTVTEIGFTVFLGCSNLHTLEIDCEKVGSKGHPLFDYSGAEAIICIVLGPNVKEILCGAFDNCVYKTTFLLPDNLYNNKSILSNLPLNCKIKRREDALQQANYPQSERVNANQLVGQNNKREINIKKAEQAKFQPSAEL